MPHPDEGVIHAWLDGELNAAEAARVEALIASDPAWGAAAAEARGLKAASSRILHALDHVPAEVAPKRASSGGSRSKRWWTIRAAALLVVVAGTSLVLRERDADRAVQLATQPSEPSPAASAPPRAPGPVRGGDESKALTGGSATPSLRSAVSAPRPGRADATADRVTSVEHSAAVANRPGAPGAPSASVVAALPRSATSVPTPGVLADSARARQDSASSQHPAPALLALKQMAATSAGADRREAGAANRTAAGAAETAAKSSGTVSGSPEAARCFEVREPRAFAGRVMRHPPDSAALAQWRLIGARPDQFVERGDSLLNSSEGEIRVVSVRVSCPPQR